MPTFDSLYTSFENPNNVCQLCEDFHANNVATRFLLIRSLAKENLIDIIRTYSNTEPSGNIRSLTKQAYETTVTIPQLLDYIESKRNELIEFRRTEVEGLSEVLEHFPIVGCGVRNDKVDDILKAFVRNKSIKSLDRLLEELDSEVLPKIRQYSLWSYYNQTANDIIELSLLSHPKVIPTLRKIKNIDFFLKIDGSIVPFDLKFTHISDAYFDLVSQGICKNNAESPFDDFILSDHTASSELKVIRAEYSAYRKNHSDLGLPTASSLSKSEIIDFLSTASEETAQFVQEVKERHSRYVPTTGDDLHILEWWNYKYQGERLFCNNNRFFVFLAYRNLFTDGRELKGKTEAIKSKITELLDGLTQEKIHTISYHYDKEASLVGDYTAQAISTIYSE